MTTRTTGRLVGILLLATIVGGMAVNVVLTAPLFGEPGFLEAAAPNATAIGASAVLGILVAGLSLAIAVLVLPVLRPHTPTLAVLFVAVATVAASLAVVEQGRVMAMLSLSEAWTAAAPADRPAIAALRPVVADARNWLHFTALLVGSAGWLVFYAAMLVSARVPRLLAAAGVAAVVLQVGTLVLPFFGRDVVFALLAPVGLVQLVLAGWLLVKGFPETLPKALPEMRNA